MRALVELHVNAYRIPRARLFLLAKALEMVGGIFGNHRERAKRNASVEAEIQRLGIDSQMTKSVEWLFDVANQRFEVRHAWDKNTGATHPRIQQRESVEFEANVNRVVRAIVCDRLGLKPPTINQGPPPATGKWDGDCLEFTC
jgi:hypothetical protein